MAENLWWMPFTVLCFIQIFHPSLIRRAISPKFHLNTSELALKSRVWICAVLWVQKRCTIRVLQGFGLIWRRALILADRSEKFRRKAATHTGASSRKCQTVQWFTQVHVLLEYFNV